MNKIRTLEEALSFVPEYTMLRQGLDIWQEGDEYYSKFEGWTQAVHMSTRILCEMGTLISHSAVRRRIPQKVRDAYAILVLYRVANPVRETVTREYRLEDAAMVIGEWLLKGGKQ